MSDPNVPMTMTAHSVICTCPVTAVVHSAPATTKVISEGMGMQAELAMDKTISAK